MRCSNQAHINLAIANIANANGNVRSVQNLGFLSATNWLLNGQLVTTNTMLWDWDSNVGLFLSSNVYRYSRNILFGMNLVWAQGRSGRYTDFSGPGVFSRTVTCGVVSVGRMLRLTR